MLNYGFLNIGRSELMREKTLKGTNELAQFSKNDLLLVVFCIKTYYSSFFRSNRFEQIVAESQKAAMRTAKSLRDMDTIAEIDRRLRTEDDYDPVQTRFAFHFIRDQILF